MPIKKWKLLSRKDVSPSTWFPIESRSYQMSNGKVVEEFMITTLADVAMIIPMTNEGKIVLVRQYKPGFDEVVLQFPAGRKEPKHTDMVETAMSELEEETGIRADRENFQHFATVTAFPTKATEKVFMYFVTGCEFNAKQKLDPTEEIEIMTVNPEELDRLIESGKVACIQTIGCWELAKKKFAELL